ncbi:hypothetical protein BpHYR1_012925 [Brachionus plicatilis]|uniref:Uncharacterized protein n=1 Tax=Brachionus plicatilis TaxID=10195 RepID=A0A3M7P8L1_BRAPC|nr:hypothetical protein BpHYR1_012925 [Brachionus plicatilis]
MVLLIPKIKLFFKYFTQWILNFYLKITLRCAFDEKSLFPKYILDYEARMRQEHKNIINRVNKENEIVRFGIGKRNGSSLSMTNS